ncbi:HIT family protein [Candidatus Pseudothioglobus sp. Uisw_050_01]|uniref:HIT family protein n=1 Tax=Candidatus Pseudothioglobus sp. Uisw_050_01 TaxID=3230997 RepID=UPI003A8567AB
MNTLLKFKFPELLIKEYENWYLILRYEQPTLGSLILITKHGEKQYSKISESSFMELSKIIKEIEPILSSLFHCDKINYLMLMMQDPEVHYHIIPRYSKDTLFHGFIFKDYGWPSLPALNKINSIKFPLEQKILADLIDQFKRN